MFRTTLLINLHISLAQSLPNQLLFTFELNACSQIFKDIVFTREKSTETALEAFACPFRLSHMMNEFNEIFVISDEWISVHFVFNFVLA